MSKLKIFISSTCYDNDVFLLAGSNHQATAADFVDHAGCPVSGIQDGLARVLVRYHLTTAAG